MNSITKTDAIESKEYRYLLRLLGSVLNGNETPRPNDDINWAVVFSAATKHSVVGMTYYAIKSLPESCRPNASIYSEFLSAYRTDLILESNVQVETEKLMKQLTDAEVDALPVKGIVVKNFYPVPSMRTMSDVDVLYRDKDKKKVEYIFKENGYSLKTAGFDQLAFAKDPFYYFELHSALIPEGKKNHEYFSHTWDRAKQTDKSHIYSLSNEDAYIYLLEHFAKHIEGGGAGLRMVMDVYVCLKAHSTDFDREYVTTELQKLNLCKFAERVETLAQSWFNSENPDVTSPCAAFILSCPTFGVVSNAIVFESLMYERKKGKKQNGFIRLLRRLFPSMSYVNRRFPITKKCKILYPFFVPAYWCARLFKDKNVNYSSVKVYLNPDTASKNEYIGKVIEDFGFDKRI